MVCFKFLITKNEALVLHKKTCNRTEHLVAAMGGLTVFLATHLYVSNPPSASLKIAKVEACTNTSDDEST